MRAALFNTFSLIKSSLLVFFRLIFDQAVCFRVRKYLWLSIFWGGFLGFPTVIPILFTPDNSPGFTKLLNKFWSKCIRILSINLS